MHNVLLCALCSHCRHQDPRSKVEVGRSRPSLSSLDLVSHKINAYQVLIIYLQLVVLLDEIGTLVEETVLYPPILYSTR